MSITTEQASDLFRRPPERFLDVGTGAGAGMAMFFVQAVPIVFVVILPGQVIDGAMFSDKVTVNEDIAVLLAASVSV